MTVQTLVARYGLAAVFIGAGVEGETLVITGGVLAAKQMLPLWAAMLSAAGGSFAADQLFFLGGRHYRDRRWVARIIDRPAFARALHWLERHPTGFILAFRFLYGLRTVSPIAVGTSHVGARTFMLLNALAAAIWAALFTGLGYAFSNQIATIVTRYIAPEHLPFAIGALVLALLAIAQGIRWLRHHWRKGRAT
jgi:membrane protein DedA with SNARE-associated domain